MRRSSEEADDPTVPDWPDVHQCEDCGSEIYRVIDGDGVERAIDTAPMDTVVVNQRSGERVRVRARGSYLFDEARREGGWRLLDPQPVSVLVEDGVVEGDWDDSDYVRVHEELEYEWCIHRVALTPENNEPLYSDHRLTCSAQTEKFLDAMLPEFGGDVWDEVQTGAVGQTAKRVQKALRVKRLVESRDELVLPWKMFKPLGLLDDVTARNGQLGLWWRPEMVKPKKEVQQTRVQEVRQPQLSLFRGERGE